MTDPYSDVIKFEEGFSEIGYQDLTSCAWGYGFNYITREEADWILDKRLDEIEHDLMRIFGARWVIFEYPRQAALMSMRYQLGPHGFRQFKRLIAAVREERWEDAARECLDSRAAHQTPERFGRNAEALRTGESQWECLT